jgi:uncharacterized protein (DUF305 family)
MVQFSNSFIRICVLSLAATTSVTVASFALAQDSTNAGSPEQPFLSENAASMKKMMADMMITPSGDVDRDFVAMMVPHHQGAVDMAKAELKYGHNEQLRRLARQIVINQQQQITKMRGAISDDGSSRISSEGSLARGRMKNSQ